jgi:hypothetical protein
MVEAGFLNEYQGYYSTGNAEAELPRRLKGNDGAKAIMPLAMQQGRKIASFPFVEGLCFSGGLSKNYYDEKSDLDFFLITKPQRLWLCRTFLILRFKLLSKTQKKYWCLNYFVSSDNLHIAEKNIFTATELMHLKPVVNNGLYRELISTNKWTRNFLPNKKQHPAVEELPVVKSAAICFLELCFSGKFGDWADEFLRVRTLNRWRRKYPDMPEADFELQFRSRRDACKRHEQGFQNKILTAWQQSLSRFSEQFNTRLA